MSSIDKVLLDLIVKHAGCKPEEVTVDADLDDIGLDSLSRFELALDVEDEFGIDFDDDAKILALVTVQDLVEIVEKIEAAA